MPKKQKTPQLVEEHALETLENINCDARTIVMDLEERLEDMKYDLQEHDINVEVTLMGNLLVSKGDENFLMLNFEQAHIIKQALTILLK